MEMLQWQWVMCHMQYSHIILANAASHWHQPSKPVSTDTNWTLASFWLPVFTSSHEDGAVCNPTPAYPSLCFQVNGSEDGGRSQRLIAHPGPFCTLSTRNLSSFFEIGTQEAGWTWSSDCGGAVMLIKHDDSTEQLLWNFILLMIVLIVLTECHLLLNPGKKLNFYSVSPL